ncbi:MAG: LysR family transcriptional regulator [Faecousia sp.]
MDIEKMNEFVVLAQTCNFQTASDVLFTTSSTLSKHISQMEKELGHQLFDRTTRKVTLTDAGAFFLEKCKQITSIYNDTLLEMNQEATASSNTVRIAFSNNMRQYGILEIGYALTKIYPEIDIRMMEYPDQPVNTMLHAHTLDFAFSSRLDLFSNDVEPHIFADDDVVLIMQHDHPLAKQKAVPVEDLKEESFIICNSYHTSDRFFAVCGEHGFSPKVQMTTGNSFTAINAVAHNQGISLLSRTHYLQHQFDRHDSLDKVAMVDILPKMSFHVYLLHLKSRPMTRAMRLYLNYVTKSRQAHK